MTAISRSVLEAHRQHRSSATFRRGFHGGRAGISDGSTARSARGCPRVGSKTAPLTWEAENFASTDFFATGFFRGLIQYGRKDSSGRLSHPAILRASFHPSTRVNPGGVVSDIGVHSRYRKKSK